VASKRSIAFRGEAELIGEGGLRGLIGCRGSLHFRACGGGAGDSENHITGTRTTQRGELWTGKRLALYARSVLRTANSRGMSTDVGGSASSLPASPSRLTV